MTLQPLFEILPFSLPQREKSKLFRAELQRLTLHHYAHCAEYRRILDAMNADPAVEREASEAPFLPVRLFKKYELSSVDKSEVSATLKSSGTSGQSVSKIVLDRGTGINQKKALAKITADFIGSERLPLLVLDSATVLKDRALFSARGAGILGFGNFGIDTTFALDENMDLNVDLVDAFLARHQGKRILLFGFTFMVWKRFAEPLQRLGKRLSLENGVLIHGGGWKKLKDQSVQNSDFRKGIERVAGIKRIHDYYGMAEQTGSIFMECEMGRYHCSIFSEVILRRPDFSLCEIGEKGIVESLSLLPRSYPGHVLLTEDYGTLLGEDDCACGRLGRSFRIDGRIEAAELRGCSDTLAF